MKYPSIIQAAVIVALACPVLSGADWQDLDINSGKAKQALEDIINTDYGNYAIDKITDIVRSTIKYENGFYYIHLEADIRYRPNFKNSGRYGTNGNKAWEHAHLYLKRRDRCRIEYGPDNDEVWSRIHNFELN